MRVPKPLKILIIVLLIGVIAALAATIPHMLKTAHARGFAKQQTEYMQEELKTKSVYEVTALTQARISEEHASNTDTEFTVYKVNIDEKERLCWIDVKIAYGRHFDSFSSKKLEF